MRPILALLCLVLLPVPARAGAIASRAAALQARSLIEGLPAVAASPDLSVRDRQILRILAQLEKNWLAAALLGPEPADTTATLRAVPVASEETRRLALRRSAITWGYTVVFDNRTSADLDEVVIFWQRKQPVGPAVRESRAPFPAHSYYDFVLGRCDELGSYVIGVFLYGQRIFKIPEGEGMEITPEIASRFHPFDNDPCGDSWAMVEN